LSLKNSKLSPLPLDHRVALESVDRSTYRTLTQLLSDRLDVYLIGRLPRFSREPRVERSDTRGIVGSSPSAPRRGARVVKYTRLLYNCELNESRCRTGARPQLLKRFALAA
jgi:hypothetical protein